MVASTPRLVLRELSADDATALEAVFCDSEVMRFSDDGPQDARFVRRWIASMQDAYRDDGFGMWAIALPTAEAAIGYAGLDCTRTRSGRGEAELGFRLARAFWGQGYATEAAAAACRHGLGSLALQRIVALVDPGNVASLNVLRKLGMTADGEVLLPGYTHPDRRFTLARSRSSP